MITRIGNTLVMATAAALLMSGCHSKSGDDPSLKPLSAEEAANYRQVEVNVTGMTWAVGWPPKVRKALSALPGVKHVYINFKTKNVTVSIEKTNTEDDARLITALKDAGFGGTVSSTGKTPAE